MSAATVSPVLSQGSKTLPAHLVGVPPTAPGFTVTPGPVTVGTPVTVTVSGGTVAVGDTMSYRVNFGAGALSVKSVPVAMPTASFTYTTSGTYTIVVSTVDGTTGAVASAPAQTIQIIAKTAAVFTLSATTGTVTATQPFTVTIDATKSTHSPLATGLTYQFSCGLGGPL